MHTDAWWSEVSARLWSIGKKRVIDDQGAQHALREGEMRAIDARVALDVR